MEAVLLAIFCGLTLLLVGCEVERMVRDRRKEKARRHVEVIHSYCDGIDDQDEINAAIDRLYQEHETKAHEVRRVTNL